MSANNEVNITSSASISMMSDEVLGSPPTELLRLVQLWGKIKCANTYEH